MGGSSNAERTVSRDGGGAGYLEDAALEDYFEGTEAPAYVLTNEKKGIKHEDGDGERTVTPGSEYSAVAAVTDERVLLVVGGNHEGSGRNRSVSLPYTEIRSVETKTGMLKSRVTLTARTSDRYTFWQGGREDLDPVGEYVEQAISYWVTVDRRLEKAREHVSTVESNLEDGDPATAETAISRSEELLEEARQVAADFREGEHAMHRRIAQLETRLSLARIRTHWTRARHLAAGAEAARTDGDYLEAYETYDRSLSLYERAMDLSKDVEYHEADDMAAEVAGVEKAITEVGGAPLRSATEACERAVEVADPDAAVDAWRRALEESHETLALVLRHGNVFDGDPEALRFQVEWAAQKLAAAHGERAEQAVDRAESARKDGNAAAADAAYDEAREHYDRARRVAAEFRSPDPEEYERARDELPDDVAVEASEAAV
ncbi:PH domain-containing protein [Halorientalis halophila]|uniref:PH domain-containing protein n=1 Tax=Halorientalis halophila TaxID=3108499 RepID=UPI00300B0B35